MHKIIKEIENIIYDNLQKYLSEVRKEQLEDKGAIYYMNGKNGTEFDYYVNRKISDFMVFYDDENNLGAVKFTLCFDGTIFIYLYGEQGKELITEVQGEMDFMEDEILRLAAILKNEADEKLIWDSDIRKISSDVEIADEKLEEFKGNGSFYENMINRRLLLQKFSYVSKKILEEGYKVGYMIREEVMHEEDSGWCFMVGNEDDAYINDSNNIALLRVGEVYQIDSDIFPYIDALVGTAMIRVSSNEFEIDENKKEIYIQKRLFH